MLVGSHDFVLGMLTFDCEVFKLGRARNGLWCC